jgi:hypothetical protein
MALHYDITKVRLLQSKPEVLQDLVVDLSAYIEDIKIQVKDKDFKKVNKTISLIISTTDDLGIELAYEEALLIKTWSDSLGKKREILTTLKQMCKVCKSALKEIRKDFCL